MMDWWGIDSLKLGDAFWLRSDGSGQVLIMLYVNNLVHIT